MMVWGIHAVKIEVQIGIDKGEVKQYFVLKKFLSAPN